MTAISYEELRGRGFRINSTNASHVPHMVMMLERRMDTALEISKSSAVGCEWTVWLRSDLAHSRCRFCYLRTVTTMEQIETLFQAIIDQPLPYTPFDAAQFAKALDEERADCERHYKEYCLNERWGYVPS